MHANQLESHIERSLIKKVKGSYQQHTDFLAKKCKENAEKQKEDHLKPIIEEICALDQKKVHLESLMEDLPTEIDKLGYDKVNVNKFETMKTTIEKSHMLKHAADKKQELNSCIKKRQKLEEMENKR